MLRPAATERVHHVLNSRIEVILDTLPPQATLAGTFEMMVLNRLYQALIVLGLYSKGEVW